MQPKFFLMSKGVLGGLIALAGAVLPVIGVRLDAALALNYANEIVTIIGAGLALYGRVKADSPLSLTPITRS